MKKKNDIEYVKYKEEEPTIVDTPYGLYLMKKNKFKLGSSIYQGLIRTLPFAVISFLVYYWIFEPERALAHFLFFWANHVVFYVLGDVVSPE